MFVLFGIRWILWVPSKHDGQFYLTRNLVGRSYPSLLEGFAFTFHTTFPAYHFASGSRTHMRNDALSTLGQFRHDVWEVLVAREGPGRG